MTTIKPLNRGKTLGILATPRDAAGAPIIIDETWTVAAAIAPATATTGEIEMPATITEDGKISILFDTVSLTAGNYVADIRLTHPATGDDWTEKIAIAIREPVTKPTPR